MARHAVSFSSDSQLLVVRDARVVPARKRMEFSRRLPLVLDARTGRTIQDFAACRHVAYDFAQVAPDALTVYATRQAGNNPQLAVMDAIDTITGSVVKSIVVVAGAVPRPAVSVLAAGGGGVGGGGDDSSARHVAGAAGHAGLLPDVRRRQQQQQQREEEEMEDEDVIAIELANRHRCPPSPPQEQQQQDQHQEQYNQQQAQLQQQQQAQTPALINFELHDKTLHTVSRGWVDALWQTTRGSVGCGWSGRRRLDEHEVYGDGDEQDASAQRVDPSAQGDARIGAR